MAEVRLCFGNGVPKLLKFSYFTPFAVGGKHAAVSTAPEFTFLQLKKTHSDVASIRGSRSRSSVQTDSRLNCFEATSQKDTTDKRGILDVSVLAQTKSPSHCLPRNVLESVTLCGGVNVPEAHTLTRSQMETWIKSSVSRNILTATHLGGHGAKPKPIRSLHTRSLYEVPRSAWQFRCDRRLIRAYSWTGRNGYQDTPLYKSKTGYYDMLEISPTATQAQIKTAYYKQSFIYHPDKNAGNEDATFHFSQISEAYNVLGNKALRKKYDRGILSQADVQGSSRPSSAKESPSKSSGQHTRPTHSPKPSANMREVYDFDAFFSMHYGEQLQREKALRARREEILKKNPKHFRDRELGRLAEIAVGTMIAAAVLILLSLRSN